MEYVKEEILREVKRLRRDTESDFAGFGWLDPIVRRITWRYAVGSVSSRTPNMTQRPSAGLLGVSVRSGRPVVFDPSMPGSERARTDDPILLAEGLAAAVFIPVKAGSTTRGVLLLGRRTTRDYTEWEMERAVRGSQALAEAAAAWRDITV